MIEEFGGMKIHRFRYFFESWQHLAYQGGIMANLKRHVGYYFLVPFFLAFQLLAIHRILKHEKFDAIHAHWLIPQGMTIMMYRMLRKKNFPALLCTSHGTDLLGLPGTLLSLIKKFVLKQCDAVTVVSRAMLNQALQLDAPAAKVFIMPMGLDAKTRFSPLPEQQKNAEELLYVGRLVKSKAVDAIIWAMPGILAERPKTVLLIIGDGPEKPLLIALANALGVQENVYFLGTVINHELATFYRRAAVFISPSLSEGFGLTVAEALACECAVITSDLPALREMIIDGKTGLLVIPGSTGEIIRKVLLLLADPDLRHSLGQAGRQRVLEKYDWDISASNYTHLLQQITQKASS